MSARVYVGNLPSNVRASELDDLFYKVRTDHGGRAGGAHLA